MIASNHITVAHARRGSVVVIVLWWIALAALLVSSVQLIGYRQKSIGTEAVARVQARWAARAGIEYTIAVMADHTQNPVPDDAFAMVRDMDYVSSRALLNAGYDIRHHADSQSWLGPMDEHSKININATLQERQLLLALNEMTLDIVDGIHDWIDEDDDVRPLGAERDYYLGSVSYEPRNAPMRSIGEVELVLGIWPEYFRGEDWNLNNRLDANEDDGERTWPDDEADKHLDARWSGYLTTYSTRSAMGASGLPKIRLGLAEPIELVDRLGVDEETAEALVNFGRDENSQMFQLLEVFMQSQATESETTPQDGASGAPLLEEEELRVVLAETMIADPKKRQPGKMNINTVSAALLRQLFLTREHLADEIIYLRSASPEGITSLVELTTIPAFQEDPEAFSFVARNMDTTSSVYAISSRGRSWSGGIEVEITVVVDRSTLPIRILEYREQ